MSAEILSSFALVVSVTTAGFGVFQWFVAKKADLIKAAVSITLSYLEEPDPFVLMKQYQSGTGSSDKATSLFEQLEYYAYLSNKGLLNERYLSRRVKDDIGKMVEEKKMVLTLIKSISSAERFISRRARSEE